MNLWGKQKHKYHLQLHAVIYSPEMELAFCSVSVVTLICIIVYHRSRVSLTTSSLRASIVSRHSHLTLVALYVSTKEVRSRTYNHYLYRPPPHCPMLSEYMPPPMPPLYPPPPPLRLSRPPYLGAALPPSPNPYRPSW